LHDEETFAPVAPVIVVDDEAEALEVINGTRFALSAAVFSRDLDRAWRVADAIHAGMVHINDMSALHETHVPFGGIGASSVGDRLGGSTNIDLLTERRWVSIQRRTALA
jgi:benzaldehyde dehydrogenase (NAD)